MEGLLILLAVAYFLVLPILTIVAWVRSSAHADQIAQLRRTLQELESRLAARQDEVRPTQAAAARQAGTETASESPSDIAPGPEAASAGEPVRPELTVASAITEPAMPVAEELADIELLPAGSRDIAEAATTPAMPESIDVPLGVAARIDASEATSAEIAAAPCPTLAANAKETPAGRRERRQRTGPSLPERIFTAARNWLMGGNTIVRVGMLLVFLGLAFLLRYASDRIVIPLEVRYLGVALSALVALALGWRLRLQRPAYGLLMQGGAIAVMYLTVFAALKLHDQPLLSTQAGFALLVATVALSAVLAVAQDALSLAVAGALGGFATPVLLSTGGGSHVALFSYFALLNTGILGIAWFKAWRPLNLVGFFGTFSIGFAWGLRSYVQNPADYYPTTQPFLILFFLMFVAIGLLFARRMLLDDPDAPTTRNAADWRAWLARRGHAAQRYVDGTLLFGTPVVGFGLQYALVAHIDYGTAFSALVLGAFYLLLARLSHGSNPLRHRLLTEVFLALGMIFASLAIPLGLDAEWTSAAWALEGAGLYWIGHRQQRPATRAFALLLQVGALASFGQKLAPGTQTVLDGSALGALLIGLSLLGNLLVLRRPPEHEKEAPWELNFAPLFSVVGLWCLFLVAPLLCAADQTALIWGLAGVATLFGGLQWRLPAWTTNAVIVQIGAAALFAATVEAAEVTLLAGNTMISLLLGVAFLANAAQLRLHPAVREDERPRFAALRPLLSTFGLWLLYLIAPLQLAAEHTAAAWALAGLATTFAGLRLQARGWVASALLVQLFAGALFLSRMETNAAAGGVLALAGSGWQGLVIASLIGLASLISLTVAIRAAQRENNQIYVTRLAWALLFGLGFIALAVLFVLPWQTATAVWAACGFPLMWAAMQLRLKPPFWFALVLEVIAGAAFLNAGGPHLVHLQSLAAEPSAFAHAGFWTPIVIALAAFAVAWRLHTYARSSAAEAPGRLDIDGDWLSLPALLWATGWWAFGWLGEWMRLDGSGRVASHPFLATMAVSVLFLLPIARRWQWPRLAGLAGLLLPLAALTSAFDYQEDTNLLGTYGWLAYGLALAAGLALLRVSQDLLDERTDQILHLANGWLWLGAASLEMRYLFLTLGEPGSTWRWLGWVLPLAAWLLWNARQTPPRLWPAVRHPALYRFGTTMPLLAVLLIWLALANIGASGNAAPLPFLPFLNPLDLALVLVLFAGWQWLRQLTGRPSTTDHWQYAQRLLQPALLAGAFLTYTCAVLRAAHHLAGIPWQVDAMQQSMLVQASLSIAWALLALGMMVAGHRSTRRAVWIAGAVLVAVVVAKLFFIELSNRGGLERIVSFIGVGLLLLIVGYFAPLPPNRQAES